MLYDIIKKHLGLSCSYSSYKGSLIIIKNIPKITHVLSNKPDWTFANSMFLLLPRGEMKVSQHHDSGNKNSEVENK